MMDRAAHEEWHEPEVTCRVDFDLHPGDRVRLHPSRRADIFDIALDGKTATIATIERDFENRVHVVVTMDDDPGRDLGVEGKIAHRFFFQPEEVELIDSNEEHSPL